ncbi:tRNA 2-thiouridine(34) synthase MnmA, partial [Candidatus Dojkabacteria bacterium]|nr:tRNA 2-thiouridine(34) synthase MnmA [Candidatus Dojkabacteria bacterium]
NVLYVAKGENNPLLYKSELNLENMHWIRKSSQKDILKCAVAVRYNQKPVEATLEESREGVKIRFSQPVRAIAPGQSAVVYVGDECIGGGVIT